MVIQEVLRLLTNVNASMAAHRFATVFGHRQANAGELPQRQSSARRGITKQQLI
jgi:hypothetical protein